MQNISALNKQIESLRSKLNKDLSNIKALNTKEILKCSQDLDKLILKYYNSIRKSGKVGI